MCDAQNDKWFDNVKSRVANTAAATIHCRASMLQPPAARALATVAETIHALIGADFLGALGAKHPAEFSSIIFLCYTVLYTFFIFTGQ